MNLSEALIDIQTTQRSRTFAFACHARELIEKLDWLKTFYGNKTIKELEGK